MNAYNDSLTLEERRIMALNAWFEVFDDLGMRMDCPSTHHLELLRQADEMDRMKLVGWAQWRDLRVLADLAYLRAVAGQDYHP